MLNGHVMNVVPIPYIVHSHAGKLFLKLLPQSLSIYLCKMSLCALN